ncbi:MAG: DUF167 domain-containing protein [Candidatus Nanoarchaeia archaeon]
MSKIDNELKISLSGKKVIELIVKPKSSKSEINFDAENQVFIFKVKSLAEDGKANAEILKMIKKQTGKESRIISGATSRRKLVRVESLE